MCHLTCHNRKLTSLQRTNGKDKSYFRVLIFNLETFKDWQEDDKYFQGLERLFNQLTKRQKIINVGFKRNKQIKVKESDL